MAEYVRQGKRTTEELNKERDLTIQIRDLNWDVETIQASQRLRDAGKQVDNLIQNVNYLGQMGAPWVSSVHLAAQQNMIKDAEKKFAEMKTIEQKVAQIRELGNDLDTAQFEKQMADIADDLNMKVGSQIQNALNDMTAADMAGQLDTVDWVTQFKRALLERLDNSISWYTQGSMAQMQYVTEQYTKIADDAQTRLTEWTKNSNTVNTDMSTAKGIMVDGNGTPIYDVKWNTIPMPQKPPIEPVFDKERWLLTTFSKNEKGEIVAKQTEVGNQASVERNGIQQAANMWMDVASIQKLFPNASWAEIVAAINWVSEQEVQWAQGYQWPAYTPADPTTQQTALNQIKSLWDWSRGWQCGSFVNNYLQDMWIGRLYVDPIDAKKTVTNTNTPVLWAVAVIDWTDNPNATEAQKKYGHVGIVTAINGNQITLKQSNKDGTEKVFTSTYDASKIYWYFDPTLDPKQAQTQWAQWGVDYKQYGLLSNTDFNPSNKIDQDAKRYMDIYIKSGKFPTATQLYGTARAKDAINFWNVANRANELYYAAAWTAMPDPQMITSNKKLIQDNNKILNKQEILGDTIVKNFDLAIKWEMSNNVNKNATRVNRILNPVYLALWDPAVNQAMVSNGTISQEFANLISIRNSGGTLAADKMMAEELIKFGTSIEAQKAVVERLKAEAANIHSALKDQNTRLRSEIDPLELSDDNPNRQNTLNPQSAPKATNAPAWTVRR